MPNLTPQLIDNYIAKAESPSMTALRDEDIKRDWIYNGKILEVVSEAIINEFKKPETVQELHHRLIPINIVQKIINKLSMVYKTSPMRKADDGNEDDNELIETYEDVLKVNRCMKTANRHFKLHKRALVEIYLGENGTPSIRALKRGTYEVFSSSMIDPQIPDTVMKILKWDHDPAKRILEFWTDTQFLIVNGKGAPMVDMMLEMGNENGVNPFGTLPFVYVNESDTEIVPLPDDDLLKVGVAIPLLLSDLAFASKYQAWSIIYTIGVDGDIPMNPNSLINLDYGPDGERPEIDMIKPEVDTEQQLRFVETVLAFLLSTKNINAGTIQGTLTTSNVASGISKMLDQSESMEDREDQQQYFIDAEKQLWNKLAKFMIPYWTKRNLLDKKYAGTFSDQFEISVHFPPVTIVKAEKEVLDEAAFRIEKGFSSTKRELKRMNPHMKDEEIDELLDEIADEKASRIEAMQSRIENDFEDDDADDDGDGEKV